MLRLVKLETKQNIGREGEYKVGEQVKITGWDLGQETPSRDGFFLIGVMRSEFLPAVVNRTIS